MIIATPRSAFIAAGSADDGMYVSYNNSGNVSFRILFMLLEQVSSEYQYRLFVKFCV